MDDFDNRDRDDAALRQWNKEIAWDKWEGQQYQYSKHLAARLGGIVCPDCQGGILYGCDRCGGSGVIVEVSNDAAMAHFRKEG